MGRVNRHVVALLGVSAGLLAMPSLASSASGGVPLSGGGASSGSGTAAGSSGSVTNGTVQPANARVSARGNGISVASRASTALRQQLSFTGHVPASDAGAVVEIERLGHETGWTWAPTAHGRVRPDGSFTAVWDTNHIGRFSIRAVIQNAGGSHAAAASPTLTVTVYRRTIATLFGPGFWGSETACGERLTRSMLGVANRTLPCGTQVALYWRGRTIVVPVIDRGPYANHADYDLTMATARALGMSDTETIGAVSLPRRR
jgi:rare lipoprotein A